MARGTYPSANRRAKGLLLSYLSVWQRSSFHIRGRFTVRGSYTGRKYTIRTWGLPYANIRCGRDRYCLVLDTWHPRHDHFLAQAISISVDEIGFLNKAVRYKDFYPFGRVEEIWP